MRVLLSGQGLRAARGAETFVRKKGGTQGDVDIRGLSERVSLRSPE